jgi:hypothetical protein
MFTLKDLSSQKYPEALHQLSFVYIPIYVLNEISSSIIIVNDYNKFVKVFLGKKLIEHSFIQSFPDFDLAKRNYKRRI